MRISNFGISIFGNFELRIYVTHKCGLRVYIFSLHILYLTF